MSEMAMPEAPGYLTTAEVRAIDLTAELWNLMVRDIIGPGSARSGDISELAHHVHAVQQMIMSQAAARAYPGLLRPLGGDAVARVARNGDQG
jgi:hypothetical protein